MKHNSLLHFENSGFENNPKARNYKQINQKLQVDQPDKKNQATTANVSNYQLFIPSQVVLATAIVDAVDKQGNSYPCRIMLDGGSQPHVITERFAEKLGLKKVPVDIPLGAIDNPADLVSRGRTAHEFLNANIWQHGPNTTKN